MITERGDRGSAPTRCSRPQAVRGRLPLERLDPVEMAIEAVTAHALSLGVEVRLEG